MTLALSRKEFSNASFSFSHVSFVEKRMVFEYPTLQDKKFDRQQALQAELGGFNAPDKNSLFLTTP